MRRTLVGLHRAQLANQKAAAPRDGRAHVAGVDESAYELLRASWEQLVRFVRACRDGGAMAALFAEDARACVGAVRGAIDMVAGEMHILTLFHSC